MQRIVALNDIGIGKRCLIIGGGMSVNEFDFDKLPIDMVTIAVNESGIESKIDTDYMMYNDNNFLRVLDKLLAEGKIPEKTKIICFANNWHLKADYSYTLNDIYGCDDSFNTGVKALMIARRFMKFDEIYLIGFDFHTRLVDGKKQSHFYGDNIEKGGKYEEQLDVNDHLKTLNKMIAQFDCVKDYEKVYNCYRESSLKLFPFQLPY